MDKPKYISQNWMKLLIDPMAVSQEIVEFLSFWSVRSCGLACASSAITYFTGIEVSQITLFNQCVRNGGYSALGWKHVELANLISSYGIKAKASPLPIPTLLKLLSEGYLIIASVTHKFPEEGSRGGHLILVYDVYQSDNQRFIRYMDPSAWGKNNTTVSFDRFCKSFTMNGIILN